MTKLDAKAMGFRCLAIDGGESKRELCLQLGADAYLDFLSSKDVISAVMTITRGGAHGMYEKNKCRRTTLLCLTR